VLRGARTDEQFEAIDGEFDVAVLDNLGGNRPALAAQPEDDIGEAQVAPQGDGLGEVEGVAGLQVGQYLGGLGVFFGCFMRVP